MISETYAVFKKFNDPGLAEEFAATLRKHGIDCLLADNSPAIDITFTDNTLQQEVQLRIKQEDFLKAGEVLKKEAGKLINQIDKDYYLFEFSSPELYEILLKPDEWSFIDYKLSQKILAERGQEVNEKPDRNPRTPAAGKHLLQHRHNYGMLRDYRCHRFFQRRTNYPNSKAES